MDVSRHAQSRDDMRIALLTCDLHEESSHQTSVPFGLLYLASYAKKYLGEPVECQVTADISGIFKSPPHIVGISCMSRNYPRAVAAARAIRETLADTPLILGGSHITGLPSSFDPVFDAAVLGEGEETFLELLRTYSENGSLKADELEKIRGIVFHDGEDLIRTPPRPEITPLDRIPPPARSLWDLSGRFDWLMSSRGCPFGCVFCPGARTGYRKFSPEYTAEEIEILVTDYHASLIGFRDDLCFSSKKWVEELSAVLRSKNLPGRLFFGATSRADIIDEELLSLLVELNVKRLSLGIESASPPILDYYKDGTLTIENVQRALDLCCKSGIPVEASFIIGAPGETAKDILATYTFILDNYKKGRIDFAPVTMLTPYPGTGLWKYAEERGLVDENFDWTRLEMGLHNFNPYTYLYLNEVIPFRDFLDYLEFIEDLHYTIGQYYYTRQGAPDAIYKRRLDRDLLQRFREKR